jgi:subtilisin family serine protease
MTRAIGILVASVALFVLAVQQHPAASPPAAEQHRGHPVAPGEVLVAFTRTPDQASVRADVDADAMSPVGRGAIWRVHSGRRNVAALLASFAARQDVAFVEPNYIVYAVADPTDPRFPELWGLKNIGQVIAGVAGTPGADISASRAWDLTRGTRNVVVGVVDTGIDYSHPDLAGNVWSAPAPFSVTISGQTITCAAGTHGFNAITRTCDPFDDNSHGSHVSGTIGAVGHNGIGVVGINQFASVMGLKFLTAAGSGTTANAISAIEFAVQARQLFGAGANVRVLSNSWGGVAFSQALLNEINRANQNDMLFVAAAGNNGSNNDATAFYPSSFEAPNVVSVAATDNRDGLASFSNYGMSSVHLGAPGVQVLSSVPGADYKYFSGTSMATPHVSGAAALLLSRCTNTSTAALKTLLLNAVDPIPSLAGRTTSGGRLNVGRAVESCGRAGNTAPIVTLTAPTVESAYDMPGPITVAATAADGDGTIAQVAFYAGTMLIAVDTTAPYEASWSNPIVGHFALTAVATDNDGATATSSSRTVHVLPGPTSRPFGGTAAPIPGVVEAENFNEGGEGFGYHDLSAGNAGGQYRQTDVDIETTSDAGGGYSLGYVQAGEWLAYSVSVQATATYRLDARVASMGTGGAFHVEVDGIDITGRLSVPNTGGWQTWQTISVPGIQLTAGPHIVLVVVDNNGSTGWLGNLNYLRWTSPGINAPPSVQLTGPANGSTYTAPATVALSASASDPDGTVTQVAFYRDTTLIGTDSTSPYTFSWTGVLTGTYVLRAVATDNTGASTTSAAVTVQVVAAPKSSPFGGVATVIPGVVEAENFDNGGEGVAYHDTTAGNSVGQYRQTDVDIETTTDPGGQYSLGYVVASEWLKYSVSVTTTGNYTLDARVASQGPGGVFHIEVDDVDVTGAIGLPDTGGWQSWRSVLFGGIPLAAGPHVIRLAIDGNGPTGYFGNINALRWNPSSTTTVPPTIQLTSPADGIVRNKNTMLTISATAADSDGTVSQVAFYAGSSLLGVDTSAPFSLNWTPAQPADYTLTARALDNDGASMWSSPITVHIITPTTPTPYGGTPAAIPGTVEAENFDDGGEGLAYHDTTAGNAGGQYRQTDVDLEATIDSGLVFSMGYITAGEWVVYSVNVAATGSYTLQARVAAAAVGGGTFHLEVDGVNVTGALTVPNTGGWQNWQTITRSGIALTAGPHRLRVVVDTVGTSGYLGNLNYLRWVTE